MNLTPHPARNGRHTTLGLAAILAVTLLATAVTASADASEGFGVTAFSTSVSSQQAGAHADFTTSFTLGREALGGPAGQLKNLKVVLPEGLAGDPRDIPQCTPAQLTQFECQPSSQVGVLTTSYSFPLKEEGEELLEPTEPSGVYNMVPSPGHPATFAAQIAFATVLIQADVTRDGKYRLVANVSEISTLEPLVSSSLTMWGVPADPSHDGERFLAPPGENAGTPAGVAPAPFMINPSDCTDGPLHSELQAESWTGETTTSSATVPAPTGCDTLHVAPELTVTPETTHAGSPSGYDVNITVPQQLEPYALATPDLRDATVTLPAGTVVSPSAANGLEACSLAQIGLGNGNPVGCPDASKLGTVEIISPLLAEPLKGAVYAAAQTANPFGSLLAIYLTAEGQGVQVKLAGHVQANPATGQLTTTFKENPELPFSELKVHLFGGPGAVLSNPTSCGPATASAQLGFYNSPTPLEPISAFTVTGCGAPQFNPTFTAATSNPTAGAYSPLTVNIGRADADQDISGVQVTTAPGLEAILAGVPECAEPQASLGTCPASTEVGHTVISAGPGSQPVTLPEPGQANPVYLTTGYKGAPYGLTFVVPAVAGPFNLGTVVDRARIDVNPTTGQAIITSDPLPQILQGIPLQTRMVSAVIDREHFTFNPTGCEPETVTGTISSAQGSTAHVQSAFQAGGCRNLTFKPSFTASTQGNDSGRGNGASLTVRVATHQGPTAAGGGEANIAKVDVQLPRILPSKDATLKKACTEQQFAANPAGCPAGATVGTAIAHTPILPDPLEGPAILVSHGGAAFPDLDLILHGNGLTVVLTGHTNIEHGVTYSNFETVPDAPISSFELKLPEGPGSILAAYLPNGGMCERTTTKTVTRTVTIRVHGKKRRVKRKVKVTVPAPLPMPTTITAQDGQVLKQTTNIAITGCPGSGKASKARRARTTHTSRKAAHR